MRRCAALIAVLVGLAAAGCGGGGSAQPGTVSAAPVGAVDGQVQARAAALQREGQELAAKVLAVEVEGARARRSMWRASDRGCYSCAESYRRQLHESGKQLDRLRLRIGSTTRRARALLEQVGAQP